jgi:CHAT domain-containing protein/tetratricopeptide (TPR) repeat protein
MLCGLVFLLSLAVRAEELGVGQHHRFPLHVRAGETAHVRIDQTNIDVVVTVRQAERGLTYEVTNPYDNAVPEEVFLVAGHSSDEDWLLDIAPRGATTKGTYTLTVERRPATEVDRKRAETDAAYWQLYELLEKRIPEARKRIDSVLAETGALVTAYRELGDGRRQAEALRLQSAALFAAGKRDESARANEEALAKTRAAGFEPMVPLLLDAIATYVEHTRPQEAMDHWMEALATARRVGSKLGAARVLNRFGTMNRSIDPRVAIDYYEQAMAIWTETGDRQRLAFGHHNMAGAYRSLAQHAKAVESIERALAIFRELGDEFYEASTLTSLGIFLNYAGRYDEAARAFEEALSLARARGFQSPTVTALIAYSYLLAGCDRWVEARVLLDEAEVVAKDVGGLDLIADSRAMIELRSGHPERALGRLQSVVDAAEKRWATVRGGSIRTKFFAHERYRYDALIDALVRLERSDEAFGLAERSRSRALLSLLSEARTDVRAAAPPELVARASALEQQLAKMPPQPDEDTRRQVARITAELEQAESDMRRALPGYQNLTEPAAPSLAHVRSLLDEDTLLLYYNLSFNNDVRRGFLWALTKNEARLETVPTVEEIDPMVRLLLARLGAGGADRNLTRVKPEAHRDPGSYWQVASRLSDTILGPVRDRIRSAKRIVIVTDGMLQYVPFAALPMPGNAPGHARAVPLADTHEVIYLPSASVLELLRSQAAARTRATNTLALFGDPVFSAGDARARGADVQVSAKTTDSEVTRAAADAGIMRDGVIPRLVFTAAEAREIAAIVPASRRRIYTGFEATKQAALDSGLASYRILHFATHGIVDDTHPALSGLLLSLYDRKGREVDGFLRLNDIFQMQLGADLVVLSGCRTGLGKEVRSEGMVGLARGFLYAGAQKVVVTLWNIDDRATAELMSRFYRGMLRENLSPADALRRAQASIRRDPRWAHPYYWAAFTYIGDWR